MIRRDSGFTLLELLVALVVLGFVLTGIAAGVQFGQRATTMQARSIAKHVDLDSADRILRRLVAGMDPGTATEPPHLTADPAALGFTTDLSQAAAALPGNGQANIGLGVDGAHQLVLRWTPALHAVALAPPTPPATAVLVEGVERVEFAYWDGSGWVTNWTEKKIPQMVRIRLHFPVDSQRGWPDIIAATRRLGSG